MSASNNEPREYRLKDGIEGVVRAGLVLEGDETVELRPSEAQEHEGYIEPVNDPEPEPDDGEAESEEEA